jgi:O-antigen ligase
MTLYTRLLIGTLIAAVLAFGAVYWWGYWPMALSCAGLGVWGLREGDGSHASRWTLRALVAVAAAIALQLIPLPYNVFATVAPGADRVLSEYNTAYSVQPPSWHPLSIAPLSTLSVLVLFAALALFLTGVSAVAGRLRLTTVASALAIVGIALAIFGVVQLAFFTENQPRVYGFWSTPEGALPFGPFINKNHYAGWTLMALPVVFGYFCGMVQASWRDRGRRFDRWLAWATRPEAGWPALMGFCVLAMGTSIVLSKSRSGIASFAIVLVVLAVFIIRRTTRRLGQAVAALGVLALLVVAIAWAGADSTALHFAQASRDLPGRLGVWRDTIRMIQDFPWFGSGLGTFWMAMLVYQTGPRDQIFFQAHNDYLQLAAEGGLLVGIPVAITLAGLLRIIARRFREAEDSMTRWIRAGAFAGLVGIAAQSLVEFSLQLPANAALCAVLVAITIHRSGGRPAHARGM